MKLMNNSNRNARLEEYDENKDRRRLMAFIPLISPYALQANNIKKEKDRITIYQPHEIPKGSFKLIPPAREGLGRRIGNVHNFMVNRVVLMNEHNEMLAEGHVTQLEIRNEAMYEDSPIGSMMVRSPEYRVQAVLRDIY